MLLGDTFAHRKKYMRMRDYIVQSFRKASPDGGDLSAKKMEKWLSSCGAPCRKSRASMTGSTAMKTGKRIWGARPCDAADPARVCCPRRPRPFRHAPVLIRTGRRIVL